MHQQPQNARYSGANIVRLWDRGEKRQQNGIQTEQTELGYITVISEKTEHNRTQTVRVLSYLYCGSAEWGL